MAGPRRRRLDELRKKPHVLRPSIYLFLDYKEFFRVWIEYLKESLGKYSMRQLSRDSGLALGHLSNIISGKRPLTHKALAKLLPHLHLNEKEEDYLEQLRILTDSKTAKGKNKALAKIHKFQEFKSLNPQEVESYQYLSHWYYVAIREMVLLPDFKEDPKWIQKRLRYEVSLENIKQALCFFKRSPFYLYR